MRTAIQRLEWNSELEYQLLWIYCLSQLARIALENRGRYFYSFAYLHEDVFAMAREAGFFCKDIVVQVPYTTTVENDR